jgi:uncharacterized damage-inducible protein DinB
MTALDVIRRLHEHRMWSNARLLAAVESVPTDDLRKNLAIGQGTLWRSLVHMYAAEWAWLAALEGNEDPVLPGDRPDGLPGNQEGEGGVSSLSELREAWAQIDARWRDYLAGLSEDRLDEVVYKISSTQRTRQSSRLVDILLHVCTHAHYTTAQAINMLRQVGAASLPDPMLITMARQEMAARAK